MISYDIFKRREGAAHRMFCGVLAFTFFFSWILPPGYAQLIPQNVLNLPTPGTMVTPSAAFTPALINGITIHPENPLEFDFIVGTGDDKLQGKAFEEESTKLIKYFLASLTVPEDEMWVNLSPYEKDRIIPEGFGTTEMGRDLLAQDYILKQLTASLMYPEKELGSEFWKKIYQKAREQYGTTEIPVNTFNKVWIVPEKAVVYEHGNSAFVVKSRLRVMLEEDYEAMGHKVTKSQGRQENVTGDVVTGDVVTTGIIREVILPAIEKEVNEGKGFANLRQIYHSAILAAWFKQNLRQTLLGQVYVDKAKTKGVDVEDKTVNQKIYAQYLEAFKKGVYNYIKEDYDPATQEMIPRKYFSGGANLTSLKTKDVLETYEQPLTSLQRQIVDALLASPQQEVNITLLELSQKRSAADIQKAVASSRQAAEKSSSPVLPPSVKRLLVHSEYLIGEMNDALAAGDTARLKARLEEARVPLPGSESGRPYLFAIGAQTAPEERDVSGMSVGEIQGRLSDYIEISEDEARKLKERDPFSFRTKELSEKNGRIYEAALKAGLLGVRYIATNIKKFSENSHLAYIEFLKRTVAEYNGYVVVLLSVEESPDVLQGDGAGMATLMHAIEAKLGKEFLRSAQIDIITDGGLKTRGGNWTGKYGYNGVMPTPYGIVYYRRAMTTLGKVRLQHKDFGRSRIYWTASDGDYEIGDLTYGEHKEADLQDDGSWSMIIHGKEEKLLDAEDMQAVFQKVGDILQKTEVERIGLDEKAENALLEKELAKDPQMAKILTDIKEKKLEDLGQNFSDPETGRLVNFKEKGKSNVILQMLREIHTNKIIPNAFLVVYSREAFSKQLEHYKELTSEGKRLAEYGGSYFQAIVQSRFDQGALGKLPAPTQAMFNDLSRTVFPRRMVIAAGLGETGRFRDRGNTDLLSRAYSERIEEIRGRHLEEQLDRGMMSDRNVTIQLEEGDVAILENVQITADRPAKLTLKDGVFIQNSRIHLKEDTVLPDRTIIIDSNLEGKLDIHGGNTVILGVVFKKGETLLDINADGRWEAVETLEVYPGETMVSILTTDGTRYINRTLTDASYKGETLLQIANGDMAGLAAKHPRLAGVQGVSEPDVDLLTMRNWLNLVKENVNIAKAKESMDYVKTYEEMNGGRSSSSPIDGKMAMTEVPDSEWGGRTVVIRPDFNVPLDEQGKIADDSRIQASLETIRYVLERGAKVVIISHLGDPWGEIRKREVKYRQGGLSREAAAGRAGEEIFKKMSLSVVAQRLQELLPGVKVHFRARYNWTMSDTSEFIQGKMKPGEVFLLENVRFNPGEKEKKDIYFAGDLMKGADIIVSDGLSVAHRNDVSMTGRPGKDVPRVAGLAFVREVRALKDVRDNARTIVMGGSKVSGKIGVIRTFLDNPNVGKIMVGGGMANAFFVAKGFSIGATVVGTEPADVDIARTLLENSQVVIPSDAVAVDNFDIPTRSKVINFDNGEAVPDGWVIVDIGPATIAAYQEIIARDGLTFWNGPMGAFDVKSVAQFARKGTNGVGEAVADARGVVGGGDTVNAVKLFGLTGYSYISTAGGAALEFLEGEELPGIAALSDKTVPPAGRPEVLPSLDDEDFVPKIEITDFLKPGVGVADALGRYWQAGGRGPVFLQEIVDGTKLKKEFVLSAINGINGSFNSRFSVEPAGLNKRLDGQTQWVQLVPRRSMGESRPLSQGLQPHASSPVEGLEVALVGGRDSDVVRNMRLIGQLLAANESSRILVGGVTALVLMEAKNWIDRADYNYKPEPVEKEINGKKKMVDVRPGILDDARSYMNHSRVILPSQVEVMDPKDPENREVILVGRGEKVPPGKVIVGFGEQTIRAYAGTISGSRSTFWNGPMDVNGTPQEISEALAQAQRRGPLFVGEASVDAAKAADLTGFVPFFRDDLSKFLDDKAMNGRRGVTISRDKDLGNGSRVRGEENLGGINLDPGLFDLQIKRDGNGVPLPLPQQPISEMHIEGFIPVIINITPVTDLPMLLGVAEDGLPKDSADTGSPATPMILGLARED